MDVPVSPGLLLFGPFRFDRHHRALFRCTDGDSWQLVSIGSRALDVLAVLVAGSGNLVSKEEIMTAVWPNVVVEEANLTVQISMLRRALDRERGGESCIQTLPGRGYRFVPRVTRAEAAPPETWPPLHGTSPPDDAPMAIAGPPGLAVWTRRPMLAAAIVLAALLAGAGVWMLRGAVSPQAARVAATPAPADRRQSGIVLPFENSSGDPAQDELAARLTREVTNIIARSGDMPTVPEITAAAYRGKIEDLRAIRREQDVHFALVGTARRQGGRLIVSAVMYSTRSGQTVWSGLLDRPDGPHALAEIVQVIYESYWQATINAEAFLAMRDHPDKLDARDLLFIMRSTRLAAPTKANFQEKARLIDRALALDPNDMFALEGQARLRAEGVMLGFSDNPAADLAIAAKAADRMLQIDANAVISLRAKAAVLRAQGSWNEAEAILRRVIVMQPTEANRRYELGQVLQAQGKHAEALTSFQDARRFAGGSDPVFNYDGSIALADLAMGKPAEAIETARLSISEFPPGSGRVEEVPWLALIAAQSSSGQDDSARADLQKFLSTPRSWHSMAEVQQWPAFNANAPLMDGLRKAGMPDD